MVEDLKWKQDGYLHFAHANSGMWTIEQLRGRFLLELDLPGTRDAKQDMGAYPSLAKAKSAANRAHKTFNRDFLGASRKARRHPKAGY